MTDQASITWNCCPNLQEPDLTPYSNFELGACIECSPGCFERITLVEGGITPDLFSLYGRFKEGGCECLHDWPRGEVALSDIVDACEALAARTGIAVFDLT